MVCVCLCVCVCVSVCLCHRGKWWQTMANWSEGFPLLAHHANRESEARKRLRKWLSKTHTHKHKHRHTNWQAQRPRFYKGEGVAQGEVGNHSGVVQKRHFSRSTHLYISFRLIDWFFFFFLIKAWAIIVSLGLANTVAIKMQSVW